MKHTLLLGLVFMAIIAAVQAVTIGPGVTLNTSSSNTSIFVNESINTSNLKIGDNYIYLEDFQFNNSKEFWVDDTTYINSSQTYDFNYTTANSNAVTSNFLSYFRFNLTANNTLLSNWSFNNIEIIGDEAVIFFTNLEPEGVKSWVWEKIGYITTTFDINFSYDSYINTTYEIISARIELNLINDVTKDPISGENFSMQLSGPAGYIFTTNTPIFNLTAFITPGTYTGLISSENYESKEIFFTYGTNEFKEVDIYFIPLNYTNLGFVTVNAFKADNTPAKYISAYAKQWFPIEGIFKKVQETKTGGDGKAELKIILEDHIYKFCIYTDEGGETCTGEEIIKTTENGQEIPITEDKRITVVDTFGGLLSATEEINVSTSNVTGYRDLNVSFSWVDLSGFDLDMCYTIYKDYQYTKQVVESNCVSGSAGSFEQVYTLNSSFTYLVNVDAIVDGVRLPLYREKFISEAASATLEGVLIEKGMLSLALVLYIVLIMVIVALLKNPFHGVVVVFAGVLGANVFFTALLGALALSSLLTFCGMSAWGLRQIR